MADDKKAGGKPADKGDKGPPKKKSDPFIEIVGLLVLLFVIVYMINGVIGLFSSSPLSGFWNDFFPSTTSAGAQTKSLSNLSNPLGARVVALNDTDVYDASGTTVIGNQPKGAHGQITKGPVYMHGQKYWYVDYDTGTDGWVRDSDLGYIENEQPSPFSLKGILLKHTKPLGDVQNPIDQKVASLNETIVYDTAGGLKIGSQPMGARGVVKQGPIEVNGERYWYVEYDSGVSGWVKESDIGVVTSEPTFFEKLILFSFNFLFYLKIFLYTMSVVMIFAIGYIIKKLTAVRKNVHALLYPEPSQIETEVNPKWQRILNHIDSLNPGDWRLAIIEADIMLDQILDKLSLPGETMGDKLKAVEKSDFATLDNAWEAHKIRNQIAHEGADFVLTEHEARRVIGLYESVFNEFQVI